MKNRILKLITALSVILLILSVCCLDSAGCVPFVISCVCLAWIVPFLKINGIMGGLRK